jgi:hypothetical protein
MTRPWHHGCKEQVCEPANPLASQAKKSEVTMKKLAIMLSLLLVPVVASAQATTPKAEPAKATAVKTHIVEAEVVSMDVMAKTLTVKGEPDNKVLKVDAAAVPHLKALKAGEKVKLTCRDNDKGEHEAITKIVVEKTPKPAQK